MKHDLKQLFICISIALLASCGSQDSKNTDLTVVNTAATATQKIATADTDTATAPPPAPSTSPRLPTRDLLTNLALAYPGGVLPPERAAAAAAQLAQNPAVLKYNATDAPRSSPSSSSSSSPATSAITPMAATSYTNGLYAPVQRAQNTSLFGSYFFSIYPTEMSNALATNPTWNLEGTAFYTSLGINPSLAPVYRFRNLLNGSYLYTISEAEKNDILQSYAEYFALEGIAWYARATTPGGGFKPLYRFRNLTNGTYLFSAYEAEKDAIVANYADIFLLEGVAYYVQQTAPKQGLELSVLAGPTAEQDLSYRDGTGPQARFSWMDGMVHDKAGNIFLTDGDSHTIRKITPAGVVSTYAGAYNCGNCSVPRVDGPRLTARFAHPTAIAIDSKDNLFVYDSGSPYDGTTYNTDTIRKITPAGVVSTFAGGALIIPGSGGEINVDGIGTAARLLGYNKAMTIDGNDNLYLASIVGLGKIRKITPTAVVTTLNTPSISGVSGIAIDAAGNLYLSQYYGNAILKMTPAGLVTTLAGSATGIAGYADGVGTAAKFDKPYAIKLDNAGNLYIGEIGNTVVRKITPTGMVSTVVGDINQRVPYDYASYGALYMGYVEGPLPGAIYSALVLSIYGGELFMGTRGNIMKVNGLP
jgi:Repeat of unknown function (DUF5648)